MYSSSSHTGFRHGLGGRLVPVVSDKCTALSVFEAGVVVHPMGLYSRTIATCWDDVAMRAAILEACGDCFGEIHEFLM